MARINILFLQLEIIPNCPPHMGMCLFVHDLQKKGIHCDTYIVKSDYISDIIPVIERGDYSLICLDSIFTIDIINHLQKQFPRIPIIVGGINAVSLLVHTDVQYAVFGPLTFQEGLCNITTDFPLRGGNYGRSPFNGCYR